MKITQQLFLPQKGFKTIFSKGQADSFDLVFAFGERALLEDENIYNTIKSQHENADYVFCSTSGEIIDSQVHDKSISLTAIKFEHTVVEKSCIRIGEGEESFDAGARLVKSLPREGLKHILVLSDGQHVNGSFLVEGMLSVVGEEISITGGLAGDGANFKKTATGLNDLPGERNIIALGFYGEKIKIHYGSNGGWDTFGPERIVTKSDKNILYELDNQPALELYKKYLGDSVDQLPGSALFFPLAISLHETGEPIVRTILSINEENGSMIFAGNVPEGVAARLMKHNFDRLVDGAGAAAQHCKDGNPFPELALLISCVGRKLVMDLNVEEEVELVKDTFGPLTALAGFYSYGEIAPFETGRKCELHNQTMTITTFSER